MKDVCNLCGSDQAILIKERLRDDDAGSRVYQCSSCSHIQILPRPSEEDDRKFYDNNLQDRSRNKEIDYEKLRNNNRFDSERHVRLIRAMCSKPDANILDIGSGYGFFINELSSAGYTNITGIEISSERRSIAMQHTDIPVIDYDINSPDRDIGQYDLITCFHVLEHMADPIQFLKNIRALISDNGIFICEVPNVNELLLETCSAYNDFYWIRAHLNYFNAVTLENCFHKAGYTGIEIKHEQRYGLLNLANWLTNGAPQIEAPVFHIHKAYEDIEAQYRLSLELQGRSDAVMAIVSG